MKILFLSQGGMVEEQIGFHEAFLAAKSRGEPVETRNVPYIGFAEKHGWDAFFREVLRINDEWKPDVVFFQFFHGGHLPSPRDCVGRLHAASNNPLVFGSQGDPFDAKFPGKWHRRPEMAMTELASCADAFFSTSMGALAGFFVRKGAKNVIFLPHAFLPTHFPDCGNGWEKPKTCDVAMVGSLAFSRRRPIGTLINSHNRYRTAKRLFDKFGTSFKVYGKGWKDFAASQGPIPFREQVAAYQGARCGVDAPPPLDEVYYASDRPFFIPGAGVPLVMFHVPRFEKMLAEGRHAWYVRKGDNVADVCERVLAMPEDQMVEHCKRAKELVFSRHLISHRVDTIISTAEALQDCRNGKITKEVALRRIRMHHFLPEIDMEEEYRHCVANWQG